MLVHTKQVAIYGQPQTILSDQGSQLVAVAKDVNIWKEVQADCEKKGTEWKLTPAGCAWRNGQAERAIAMAKKTLKQLVESFELLDFNELESALLQVASILNRRPVTARVFSEKEFYPLSPADLLLGGTLGLHRSSQSWSMEQEMTVPLNQRLEKVSSFTERWWRKWSQDAFPLLAPRSRWKTEQRNLQVGDIVMLKTEKKWGPGEYRLARVAEAAPDRRGHVRTVKITMRDRARGRGEPLDRLRSGTTTIPMAVQRLAVILPSDENWGEESEERGGGTVN